MTAILKIIWHDEVTDAVCGYDVGPWIKEHTGFSGSRALCLQTASRKILVVDSRYTLQAQKECAGWEVIESGSFAPTAPAMQNILASLNVAKICYDPSNVSMQQMQMWRDAFSGIAWEEEPLKLPSVHSSVIEPYAMVYAGDSFEQKLARVLQAFPCTEPSSERRILLTSPASIAWLFNLRAQHFAYTPTFPAVALCLAQGCWLWTLPRTRTHNAQESLGDNVIWNEVPLHAFPEAVAEVLSAEDHVFYTAETTPQSFLPVLEKVRAHSSVPDYSAHLRGVKSPAEVVNAQNVHMMEAVAVMRLLAWLKTASGITEYQISEQLECFRQRNAHYKGPSFASIVASGPNAAVVHYAPTASRSRKIEEGVILMDVGGQYLGGTTDMTRTIWYGNSIPSSEIKRAYTRVLQGHMALAAAIFPKGTSGGQLDVLARQFLWRDHYDFGHGTGHGVGNYLGVHEGPHNISPRSAHVPLEPGMIVSNEPGVYEAEQFGIRLENLMCVQPHQAGRAEEGAKEFLCFNILTLIPFDPLLVEWALLSSDEKIWLQHYHQRIVHTCAAFLEPDVQEWLSEVAAPFLRGVTP